MVRLQHTILNRRLAWEDKETLDNILCPIIASDTIGLTGNERNKKHVKVSTGTNSYGICYHLLVEREAKVVDLVRRTDKMVKGADVFLWERDHIRFHMEEKESGAEEAEEDGAWVAEVVMVETVDVRFYNILTARRNWNMGSESFVVRVHCLSLSVQYKHRKTIKKKFSGLPHFGVFNASYLLCDS